MRKVIFLSAFLGAVAGCAGAVERAKPVLDAQASGTSDKRVGRYWHFVDNIKWAKDAEEGKTPAVLLWIALPLNRPGQAVSVGAIEPPPTEIIEDSIGGNRVAFWRIEKPEENTSLKFTIDFEVTNQPVSVVVNPENLAPYDQESTLYQQYTRHEPWLDAMPEIAAQAKEIVGGESNPYRQAKLLFDWTVREMTYDYPDVEHRGVKNTFLKRKGDCGEFSHAFVAMARSLGIPSRLVFAVWYQGGGHAWSEIYLPPYGWMPVDTSAAQLIGNGLKGQQTEEKVQRFADTRGIPTRDPNWLFGNLYPNRLEVFVGENIVVKAEGEKEEKVFRFMQPGGSASYPTGIECRGLSKATVNAGFYLFDKEAKDEVLANSRAQEALALSFLSHGEYERALPGLLSAAEKKADKPDGWFQLGSAYFNLKRYAEAERYLKKSLDAKGGGSRQKTVHTWANILSGMVFDLRGERDKAIRSYQAAIDIGADHGGSMAMAKKFLTEPFKDEPEPEKKE
ncbi:MAG: tetratricopeptide repeat protein [Deltaproteobacteria bacterium]|nr:tetratricopeptide repeat protein [Deltaproteobacteria bacterium]